MEAGKRVETDKGYHIRRATLDDTQELLTLYFQIYGSNYPLALGTDRSEMTRIISDPDDLWILAVDDKTDDICGSCVFEVDKFYKIGRTEGLVVSTDHQKRGIGFSLLNYGSTYLLEGKSGINSVYTTTRTLNLAPQLAVLRDGYLPLGIFPNAHRLAVYETLTLMAKFRPGILDQRRVVKEVPEALGPILKALGKTVKSKNPPPKLLKMVKPQPTGEKLEFEFIHAPQYVQRKFFEAFTDPLDRFYPFHMPNFLMSAKNGEVDIFGYLSEADGYCAWVANTQPLLSMAGRLRPLMQQLADYGVSYIEVLTTVDNILGLEALLDVNFLPSAIYPAMVQDKNKLIDMVLMSRSMEPLNFRGMHLEKSFRPYIDQYVKLWKTMHLEVLGVFDEEK